MAKARFTASAETDLLDLWLFIAEDNLLAADDAVDSIYRSAQLLAEQPILCCYATLGGLRKNANPPYI